MKKITLFLVIILSFSFASFSQNKQDDIKGLFTLMKSDKMIDDMMNSIIPALKQQVATQFVNEADSEKFDKYMAVVMRETTELSKKLVNEEMVSIYDKYFTHDEIKGLIKFYKSPIGAKIIKTMPDITKDVMDATMTKYMPEFQAKIIKAFEELK